MLKDQQQVSMAKMAIHIYIFTISLKKGKLDLKEKNIIFSESDFTESMRRVLFDQICNQ